MSFLKIVIGTANRHKFAEIEKILTPETLDIQLIFGGDIILQKPEETGSTFFENALLKAKFYSKASGLPAIADDSGLIVDALNGRPGIFSARYAGENCSYEDNNRKLLQELKKIPPQQRTARFVCVAVLFIDDENFFSAEGIIEGKIATEMRGDNGFGYDPIFELPDGRTMAQIPQKIKNKISHRAKAFLKMRKIIEEKRNFL